MTLDTTPNSAVAELVDAGLLTDRQAEAYVLRDVRHVRRERAAEAMGISPNTLDSRLRTARDKVTAARETVATVDRLDGGEDAR